MSIRLKIIFTVIPLLVSTLLASGLISSFSAETALTRIAVDFLSFKAQELGKNADNQWSILTENNLDETQEFIDAAKKAVESFAATLIKSETELIFAIDSQGQTVMKTSDFQLKEEEQSVLLDNFSQKLAGWNTVVVDGTTRVGQFLLFEPWGWYIGVTETRDTFFDGVEEIRFQSYVILGGSALLGVLVLLAFAGYLTSPISRMVRAMEKIIHENNLSERVEVQYRDEIGHMAQTFNVMVGELEQATFQIKNFALQSVIAKKNEQKIRNIFQKYVPRNVIDSIFAHPENSLVGENRNLSILFSDIRSFTTISEAMRPSDLVSNLNRYFSAMVDIITGHNGIVDKYIGDAIMAFFGAPAASENDALLSVHAALGMIDALVEFNRQQEAEGKVAFQIGIGINYGEVTVGNIGSEKKMDYTVIGDTVNLASRLEGLTKKYHEQLVFSEFVYQEVGRYVYCRLLDKVAVKGKTRGVGIYTARRQISEAEKQGWAHYHSGLDAYYDRDFRGAMQHFRRTLELLPGDYMAAEMLERAQQYQKDPPAVEWNGVEVMHEK